MSNSKWTLSDIAKLGINRSKKPAGNDRRNLKPVVGYLGEMPILQKKQAVIKPKQAKYRNVKVIVDGERFDSRKEAKRWGELKLLEKGGKIKDLQRQVTFPLNVNGVLICKFIADYTYWGLENNGWIYTVADCKSEPTRKNRAYRIKRKLFEAIYKVAIKEV